MANFLLAIIVDTFGAVKDSQTSAATVPKELRSLGGSHWNTASGGEAGMAGEGEVLAMIGALKHARRDALSEHQQHSGEVESLPKGHGDAEMGAPGAKISGGGGRLAHRPSLGGGGGGAGGVSEEKQDRVLVLKFADGNKEYVGADQLELLLAADIAEASADAAAGGGGSGKGNGNGKGGGARGGLGEASELARGVAAAVRPRFPPPPPSHTPARLDLTLDSPPPDRAACCRNP